MLYTLKLEANIEIQQPTLQHYKSEYAVEMTEKQNTLWCKANIALWLFVYNKNRGKNQNTNRLTAAIDGISDWPGEPWETSIPKIIVGVSLIKGRCPECSSASKEFIPPSLYEIISTNFLKLCIILSSQIKVDAMHLNISWL